MTTETTPQAYSRAQIALHWTMGALIVVLVPMGLVMSDADPDGALRLWLSRAHAGLGMLLGALLVARAVVRLRAPKVAELPGSTPVQRTAMRVVHVGIYLALAAVLFSGSATSFLGDWPAYLFGRTPSAPDLHEIPPREGHETFVFALLGLTLMHVAGVVLHEIRKGGAIRRMLPGVGSAPRGE
jgi:cytochrome b561